MTRAKEAEKTMMITKFYVAGKPITQGSKRAISRGYMRDTSDEATKHQPANRLRDWKLKVAKSALLSTRQLGGEPVLCPVNVAAEFVFARKDSHWLKSGLVRSSAPKIPRGDLDKLLRAVDDSMSGIVYKDDRQIVSFDGTFKRFARANEDAGALITVTRRVLV